MVSLQSALSPEAKQPCLPGGSGTAAPKKRKREDDDDGEAEAGIELSFDTAPLPPEWQRCLDMKSGQIHYYNTRTHTRTSKDPRRDHSPERAASPLPGLDLELNLTFVPHRVRNSGPDEKPKPEAEAEPEPDTSKEMVAAVCMRCHMLVMMCRASPACPNCKFLHPPSRSSAPPAPAPPKLGFKLLCCKD